MDPEFWYEGLAGGELDNASPEFWYEGLSGGELVGSALAEGEGVGSAAGVATVLGVVESYAEGVGESEGESTNDAAGEDANGEGVGLAAGVATVLGVGEGSIDGVGVAAGVATVLGVSSVVEAVGNAAGVAVVTGISEVNAVGEAAGVATANAASEVTQDAVGNAAGTSVVSGVGAALLATPLGAGSGEFTYTPVPIIDADFNPRRTPSLSISDQIDDSPTTLQYEDEGDGFVEPRIGQHVTVDFGPADGGQLFKGPIQVVTTQYEGQRDQLKYQVSAIDYTWFLNRKRPFASYVGVPADQVVIDLATRFSDGFTTAGVQGGLPAVSVEFDGSQDFASCLTTLAGLINGHWRLDVQDIVFAQDEVTENPDEVNDANDDLLREPAISITRDASQIKTRIYVKGAGTSSFASAEPGDTEIEVESNELFSLQGGFALAGTQRIQYATKVSRELTDEPPEGALPKNGPGGSMTVTTSGVKTVGPNGLPYTVASQIWGFCTTFLYADGTQSRPSEASNLWWHPPNLPPFLGNAGQVYAPQFAAIPKGVANASGSPVVARRIWRFEPRDPVTLQLYAQINDNTTTSAALPRQYTSGTLRRSQAEPPGCPGVPVISDSGIRQIDYPLVGSAQAGAARTVSVAFSAIYEDGTETLIGLASNSIDQPANGFNKWLIQADVLPTAPSINGVSVNYYKAFAFDGETYNLIGVINVTSGVAADRIILEGIAQAVGGQPRQGQTFIPTQSLHHYLAGIPLSGNFGINTLIPAGTPVRIFEQVDDSTAQEELAVTEGGDGVHEFVLEGDYNSKSIARAAGFSQLALYSRPIVTVRYSTRDAKTKAGKTVVFNLTDPPIVATLKIQDVTIDQIHDADGLTPRYTATASTIRFSFDDLMRKILEKQGL